MKSWFHITLNSQKHTEPYDIKLPKRHKLTSLFPAKYCCDKILNYIVAMYEN